MDANDVVENLWYEAETIRRAVAAAYDAVGGPTPLPASLTQILDYIANNAGGGDVPVGSSVVTDASLSSLASAILNGDEGQTGQNLVDNVLMPTVTHIASTLENQSAINPSADWGNRTDLLGRAGFIATGLNTETGEVPIGSFVTLDLGPGYTAASFQQFVEYVEGWDHIDQTAFRDELVAAFGPTETWTVGQLVPVCMWMMSESMESGDTWPPTATG